MRPALPVFWLLAALIAGCAGRVANRPEEFFRSGTKPVLVKQCRGTEKDEVFQLSFWADKPAKQVFDVFNKEFVVHGVLPGKWWQGDVSIWLHYGPVSNGEERLFPDVNLWNLDETLPDKAVFSFWDNQLSYTVERNGESKFKQRFIVLREYLTSERQRFIDDCLYGSWINRSMEPVPKPQ